MWKVKLFYEHGELVIDAPSGEFVWYHCARYHSYFGRLLRTSWRFNGERSNASET